MTNGDELHAGELVRLANYLVLLDGMWTLQVLMSVERIANAPLDFFALDRLGGVIEFDRVHVSLRLKTARD
jgi:hypothetical protein